MDPAGGAINVHRGLNISAYFSPPGPNISKYLDRGSEIYGPGVFFRGGQICRHITHHAPQTVQLLLLIINSDPQLIQLKCNLQNWYELICMFSGGTVL